MRRYASELFGAMARLPGAPEILAIGVAPGAPVPPGVRAAPAPQILPTNLGWCLAGLPLAARRSLADVVHAPAYTAPLWGGFPLVLTIHDVSYARHPEWYPYRRDPLRLAFYRRSALAASAIVTDSGFSRDEIVAAYGVDPGSIHVVPLGAAAAFAPDPAQGPDRDDPYVLHVGDLHPRRNLIVALDAVIRLRAEVPGLRTLRLRLTGADRGAAAALEARAGASGPDGPLDLLGVVADDRLAGLYRRALAVVYPSRYEGFGLPVLEAMASGVPVVAARAGSVPEVLGPAGILVDPDDVEGFARALRRIATEPACDRALRDASLARAREFSWARTAAATVEVYRVAIERKGRAAHA